MAVTTVAGGGQKKYFLIDWPYQWESTGLPWASISKYTALQLTVHDVQSCTSNNVYVSEQWKGTGLSSNKLL